MTEINYQLRPATEADYQYCYDLLKQNMFELFSRHWVAGSQMPFAKTSAQLTPLL